MCIRDSPLSLRRVRLHRPQQRERGRLVPTLRRPPPRPPAAQTCRALIRALIRAATATTAPGPNGAGAA
eukprot:9311151-Alexandrium_andersonii.AAC.1